MPITIDVPQVYVASLNAYNNGCLHGVWIDADDEDTMNEKILEMLAACPFNTPITPSEEFAIHDHSGFGKWSPKEYTPISEIAAVGAALAEHGEVISILMDHLGIDAEDAISYHEDNYQGKYSDEEDFAYQTVQDTTDMKTMGWLESYIDYQAIARDSFMCDFFSEDSEDGDIHVWRNS